MKNNRFYLLFFLILIFLWAGISLWKHRRQPLTELNQQAADFTLQDASAQPHRLSDYRGKVVLLNFWASWCGPCRQEMPSLETFYQRYQNRGLVVLGVSVDEDGWDAIRSFLNRVPVSVPILLDETQQVSELYRSFQIPESYLIDARGMVRAKWVGPQTFEGEVFSRRVEELLAETSKK